VARGYNVTYSLLLRIAIIDLLVHLVNLNLLLGRSRIASPSRRSSSHQTPDWQISLQVLPSISFIWLGHHIVFTSLIQKWSPSLVWLLPITSLHWPPQWLVIKGNALFIFQHPGLLMLSHQMIWRTWWWRYWWRRWWCWWLQQGYGETPIKIRVSSMRSTFLSIPLHITLSCDYSLHYDTCSKHD